MARVQSTGVLQLRYVPTISNKSAPTVAELTAGKNLTPFLRRDGLTTPKSGSTIDVSTVEDRYNSTAAGSYGGDPIEIMLYRDNGTTLTDLAWTTLAPASGSTAAVSGFLVIHRFGAGTAKTATSAPTAADRVEVWPIEVTSREMAPIADNEAQRFVVKCAIPTPPVDDAVLA